VDDKNLTPYFLMRDKLCGEFTYNQLSLFLKVQVDREIAEEERRSKSKYARLASAARFN
jgi:hypothetical protein